MSKRFSQYIVVLKREPASLARDFTIQRCKRQRERQNTSFLPGRIKVGR